MAEGFLFAIVVPALAVSPWGIAWALPVLAIAALHALCIGVPLVWFLRARGWLNLGTAVGAGFVTGAVPTAILMARAIFGAGGSPELGWTDYFRVVGFYGGFGAFSGLIFGAYQWARERFRARAH